MLMFDRITAISEEGGEHGKGQVRAELDVKPDLWFFSCHFKGDPVMPGCLGLDALWQMLGFFLGWLGAGGVGRALSVGEVKFSGMVLPTAKLVEYGIDLEAGAPLQARVEQAIEDFWARADRSLQHPHRGIIMGSGGPASARTIVDAADTTRSKGPKCVGPFAVPKAMSSTASATLATWFKIKGVNYSISSACATSNHCIGNAYETIQIGKQDVIFAGGCEVAGTWTLSVPFDCKVNVVEIQRHARDRLASLRHQPRSNFVIAGGAGVVARKVAEHAKARGARIYGEIVGYGVGTCMVAPSGEGAERCMRMAMLTVKTPVDYINPHATSTPAGDPPEIVRRSVLVRNARRYRRPRHSPGTRSAPPEFRRRSTRCS